MLAFNLSGAPNFRAGRDLTPPVEALALIAALALALAAADPPAAYETNSRGAALLNRGEPLQALEVLAPAQHHAVD